jgi:hypothetical protein
MKKITRSLLVLALTLIGTYSVFAQALNDTLTFDANISKSSYAAQQKTIGNYNWNLDDFSQPSPPTVGSDLFFGINCLRARLFQTGTENKLEMTQDKIKGLSQISFYAGRSNFSGDRAGISPVISVEYSTNQGGSWTSVGTANLAGVDALTKYTFNNINIAGNIRIRLKVTSGDAGKRFNIDSLIFNGYEPAPCDAPTNLILTDNNNGSLGATWTPPATTPNNGYKIAIVPSGQTPVSSDFFINSSSNTSPTSDTLKNGSPLIDGQTYDVYLLAVCDSVGGSFSDTIQASVTVTLPSCQKPTSVTTTSNSEGVITTSWTAPSTLPGDGYKIAIVPTGNTPTNSDYFTVSSSETTFKSDTLKNGTPTSSGAYDVYIFSNCNDAAVSHSDTTQTSVTLTVCKAPKNFVMVNNNDGSVTATWTAPVPTPVNGYKIAITAPGNTPAPSDYFTLNSGDVSFTTDTLINGSSLGLGDTYYMTIYGECSASSNSNAVNDTSIVSDPTTCLSPINIVVTNNNDSTITVSWNLPINIPSNGYTVAIVPTGQTPGSDFFYYANNVTTFTTDTMPNGVKFGYNQTYDVYVLSDCGSGSNSIPVMKSITVTFPVPCEAPTNVVLTDNEDGTITATWNSPTHNPQDGYKLALVKIGHTPTANDYFTVNGSLNTFTTDSLANGTKLAHDSSYVMYIYSACSIANSDYSDTLIDTVHVTIYLPCNAPTNFVFNSNAGGKATATWTIPANGGNNGYKLAIVLNGTTPTVNDYFTIAPGIITFTTDTLKNGNPLLEASIYKATIYSACGPNHQSTTASDTALILINPCPAPTNLTAVDNQDGTVTLTWTAPSPAPNEGYLVTSNSPLVSNQTTTSTTYTTVVLPDNSYTFSVKAICNSSISNYSNGISKSIATHDTVMSVSNLNTEIVAIYPNPAVTKLSVDLKTTNGTLSVMDLTGKEVMDKIEIKSNHTEFEISSLPSGMYQLIIQTEKAISISKFIKQ